MVRNPSSRGWPPCTFILYMTASSTLSPPATVVLEECQSSCCPNCNLSPCCPVQWFPNLLVWSLSRSYSSKVWLVGDGLTASEKGRAKPGVHFVPYSQFPRTSNRGDCVYHSTPAVVVPDSYENMHACENWLSRRVMSEWWAVGIVHALEKWAGHECGDAITGVERAALAHGFRPYDDAHHHAGKHVLSDNSSYPVWLVANV